MEAKMKITGIPAEVDLPPEINNWICTDPDCYQYIRSIGDKCFEMTQINEMPDKSYIIVWSIIDLDDYTDDEINFYVTSYYDSADGLPHGIIAECIFESLQPVDYNYRRRADTLDEAKGVVRGIISQNQYNKNL